MLTAYNGVARTYDSVGNLLTDGTWTYTWQNGRELASMTDGTTTWNYTYDANGMRTQRSNGTKTYNYVYNGSQLTQMTVGNDTLYFTYGVLGPSTVTWNGTTYYYALNAQGDVFGIFDNAGDCVVFYNWDTAWGYNPIPQGYLASTLGTLNPLRYRGYVYDTETGYYYLQSRYYDPEIGRFINADVFTSTGQGLLGNNMFAYCLNNPVNLKDPTGDIAITTLILIGSAIIGAAAAGFTAYKEYQAGYDTVRIVGDSICAGFAAFSIVYTGGMSLYQCYQNYCALNAITPVTDINLTHASNKTTGTIPKAANDTLAYIDQNGRAPQGYKGGKEFLNDGRNGCQILPLKGMPYYEYDIYPHVKGTPRGLERIVIGSDHSAWYTMDHYFTFLNMRQ